MDVSGTVQCMGGKDLRLNEGMELDHLKPAIWTQYSFEVFNESRPSTSIDAIDQQSAVNEMKLLRAQASRSFFPERSIHVESRLDVLLYSLLLAVTIRTFAVVVAVVAFAGEDVDADDLQVVRINRWSDAERYTRTSMSS